MVRAEPGPNPFRPAHRLKRPEQFRQVFQGGTKAVGRYFVVFARLNDQGHPRLGLAIGRKVGNAVCRNRLKRLVREEVRQANGIGPLDLVVVGRTAAATADRRALRRELHALWQRVGNA